MFDFLKRKQRSQDALSSATLETAARDVIEAAALDEWGTLSTLSVSPDQRIMVMVQVDPAAGPEIEIQRAELEKKLATLEGAQGALVALTAEKDPAPSPPQAAAPDPHGLNKVPRLENLLIKKIIAVASGKGGVGKSTVAANLAVSLAKEGLGVGVLDADIYGPSQPILFGLKGQKPGGEDGALEPVISQHGIKVMSMGFMVEENRALIWRGPMVQTAVVQLFRDVVWGTPEDQLDVLIVDMPPGTGDAQLTLAQKIPVDGAIIVTTPQDLALADARKGLEMFRKTDVPIIGILENMSTHICSNCGHEEHIFGAGGGKKQAEEAGVSYLGDLPLSMSIRETTDQGKPQGLPEKVVKKLLPIVASRT